MTKSYKLDFLDKVVEELQKHSSQLSVEVSYFIACQFALESNFGTSHLAKKNNNYCGMMTPVFRLSTNKATSGFAKYDSFSDCVLDYLFWLCYQRFAYEDLFNKDLFARKLASKKYCPEKDYIDKIYSLFNSFKIN